MEKDEFIGYIKKEYPHIIDEIKRNFTPSYYEPGVKYHPITSGFGCDSKGSNKLFEIKNADYLKGGDMYVNMTPDDNSGNCVMTMSKAHLQFKRFDETIKPVGRTIPNSGRLIYFKHKETDWDITFMKWRNYENGKLIIKLWLVPSTGNKVIVNGVDLSEYYEIYTSSNDSKLVLNHVKGYSTQNSQNYELFGLKNGISVREIKEKIFGDPNVKISCCLFGNL